MRSRILLRTARQVGVIDQLRKGQHDADQLIDALLLQPATLGLMLDALVAIGIVEKYDQDYALSRAAALLCQYDEDFRRSTLDGAGRRLARKQHSAR